MFDSSSDAPSTWEMFVCFLKLAVPAIVTNVMGFLVIVTNGVFAGRLNDPT